jgi:hypothetical protein
MFWTSLEPVARRKIKNTSTFWNFELERPTCARKMMTRKRQKGSKWRREASGDQSLREGHGRKLWTLPWHELAAKILQMQLSRGLHPKLRCPSPLSPVAQSDAAGLSTRAGELHTPERQKNW